MTFLENDYREIITRAVCGKGRKFTKEKHTITPSHNASSILGCWVINHLYNAKQKSKDTVEVNGSYDINIWYSYNDNTKTEVVTERIRYKDQVPLSIQDEQCIDDAYDVHAKVIQQPNCLECEITKECDQLVVEVEREFVVKVIGDTKVYVKVDPSRVQHKEEDTWDFKVTVDELDDVDPNFLSNRKKD